MGTSAKYDAPPAWGPLKGMATRTGGQPLTPSQAAEFVRRHIETNGGAASTVSGGGVLGSGRAPQRAAQALAGFLNRVGSVGLAQALQQSGLTDLVGRSAHEVALGLVALCGGNDGSLDSVDARNALSRLTDELLADAETADEVEQALVSDAGPEKVADLMVRFFGHYLYEQFRRVFFEHLVQKHGDDKATSFLGQIGEYINSSLRNHTRTTPATAVDWGGPQGDRLADQIMRETLDVFNGDS